MPKQTMTHAEWTAEATRRFGADWMKWRFVCPVCQFEQSVQDYKDAGAPETAVGVSCVGRFGGRARRDAFGERESPDGKGPCDYAGFGLLRLNPIEVTLPDGSKVESFAFAEPATKEAS